MADEIKEEKKEEKQEFDASDYIDAIKKLKENSVDKDLYEKKDQENKKLIQALVDGEQLEKAGEPQAKSASELRKELFGNDNLNNLEYVSKALDLRKAVMDEEGYDIFLPYGEKIAPTPDDVEAANRVADAFKKCIEYADGDSDIFTQELQRITVDTAPMMKRR